MAHIHQHVLADPDSSRPALALMIRPWAPVAVNEDVRLVLGDSECAARAAVWVEISYGLEGAPLTYLRHILQADDWNCAEQIEQLLNGETPYATWRSGCPPALLMARPGAADAQGNPTFQMTLQLTVSGLTDSGQPDGSAITFALDRISGDELRRFGEAFDRELRHALGQRRPAPSDQLPATAMATPPGLDVNAFSSRVNAAAYDALGTDYTHDYLSEPFFREAFEGWLGALPANGRVLEIGCGHGEPIAAALTAAGQRVTGIDPSATMIAQARCRAPEGRLPPDGIGGTGRDARLRRGMLLLFASVHGPHRTADWPGAAAQGAESGCACVDRLRRAGSVHAHNTPAQRAGTNYMGMDV